MQESCVRECALVQNRVTKGLQHVSPNNGVILKYCDFSRGSQMLGHIIAICCAEMLQSFSQGYTSHAQAIWQNHLPQLHDFGTEWSVHICITVT